MNKYLLHGKLTAKTGKREELASILVEAAKLVGTAQGCLLYVVGLEATDIDSVFVTEIWNSKEDHDDSLNVVGVRELIGQAMPLLDGQPRKGQEIALIGGVGVL